MNFICSFNLTGMIGVYRHPSQECFDLYNSKQITYPAYEGHVYTFLNATGTDIAHSERPGTGVMKMPTPPPYIQRSYYYLKLKLPNSRLKK